MPLYLMILTSYFAIEPKTIRGGIGHRYVGLYGSLVKALLNNSTKSKVFWYSHTDQHLRIISELGCRKAKVGLLRAILNAISNTYRNKSYLAVIVAYPYAIPKLKIFEYLLSLLVLKISSGKRVRIIIDDFDPPVEAAYAFSEAEPSTPKILALRLFDTLSLKLASFILALTESYRQHMARIYRIEQKKIFVLPVGSLIRYINYVPPKFEDPHIVLYSGSAMRVKDVNKLVSTIAKLRRKGLQMELHIAGEKLMVLPKWVHNSHSEFPRFINDVLSEADIGVIPYPRNKLHFYYTMPAKLSEYMAAGKPIISTNLKEVGNVIRMYDCGLVARDWKEFELHLESLYHNRKLAKELGENGRRAAEKYFNYELLAEVFLDKLVKVFKSEN